MSRKLACLACLCFLFFSAAAEQYKIGSVVFDSKEKTDPKMLMRKISPIEKDRLFASREELEEYLAYIRQQLINTRLLENIEYSWEPSGEKDGEAELVNARYSFEDSKSFMVVPYPTYSSNTGLQFTVMANDQNFLGKTNPFKFFANCTFGTEEEPDNFSKITPGFGVEYSFPFNVGPVVSSWNLLAAMAWTIGDSMPEFGVVTGPSLAIPVGKQRLDVSFRQSAIGKKDFKKYDDNPYFAEQAKVSLPLTIAKIGTATPLVFRPYVEASYNWDTNRIDGDNDRLSYTPKLNVGQTTSVSGVDWLGNFRNGYYFSTTQAISKSFKDSELSAGIIPYVDCNLKIFKAWKYAGLAANLRFFTMFKADGNNDESQLVNIGPFLRGALDKQVFDTSNGYSSADKDDYNLALETEQAVILSLEAPFHLVTTNFGGFFSAINAELQLSPFIDVALLKNRAMKNGVSAGKIFSVREGIYCAGIEGFIYPTKFKSYVLHANIGFDIGKFIIKDYNDDWRKAEKGWEISVGFGHHF
ncbi:MAG: hypothetical protein IJL80_00230 [Treponema sp.]|nr:hypothetical protein [Treponema sp.]